MVKKIIAVVSSLPLMTFGFAGIAFAGGTDIEGNDYVGNKNNASVINHASSSSNTGNNYAGGSKGGNGGNGGDIDNSYGKQRVKGSSTGKGGNGGNGGFGGTIHTGSAESVTGIVNTVNTNNTAIDRGGCGCEGVEVDEDKGNTRVYNNNYAHVVNVANANSNTGLNTAKGSKGGPGGDGGDIENDGGGKQKVGQSHTGAGGNGGHGSAGGLITTGMSSSSTGVVNVVNTNVTRIRR